MSPNTKKIRKLMIDQELTLKDIAGELEVTVCMISLVINNHRRTRRIQEHIANRLGVSVEEVFPER